MISEFALKKRVFTGDRYISDLVDIDAAIGTYLVNLLDSIKSYGSEKKYDPFTAFTNKPKSDKLFICAESDPKAFLLLMKQKFFNENGGINSANKSILPLVYFNRETGFSIENLGNEKVVKNCGMLVNDSKVTVGEVDALPVMLTYHVYIMAWEQLSLTKLASALFAAMATSPRNNAYKTAVFNTVFEQSAFIGAVQNSSWTDLSLPSSEDRLLVMDAVFEVHSNIFQTRVVKESDITLAISEPNIMIRSFDEAF